MAPCKPALCDYFIAIFQLDQNRLKFGMSTHFVLKNVPVFFFKNAEKYGQNSDKIASNSTPPPPHLLCPSQRRISILESQNTVRVPFMLLVGGGWCGGGEGCGGAVRGGRCGGAVRGGRYGGWTLKNVFEPLFSRLWKKMQGHFFTEKESACQISDGKILSNLENRYEIVT